jgi:nucleosome binding factor SPN SPT16 subunit
MKNAQTENKRSEHQKELLTIKTAELNEEIKISENLKHRFDKNFEKVDDLEYNKQMMKQIKSYPTLSHIPKDLVMGKIYCDLKSDSVILPIGKTMVPFHASLIKSVSKSEIVPFSYLRINFHIPLTGLNNLAYNDLKLNTPIFVKELSFKSRDAKNYSYLLKTIKDLIKKVKAKEKEEKERSEIVASENLVLLKGKKIQLHDVIIRPNISNKRTNGVLEAHQNGFRYTSNKSESLDIIYKNIKHAFYQPCENELVVLLHFHLKNPIMIGKKKSTDVQFLREAGIQTDDLDIRRRGNDYEEYENELREYQHKQKINEEFHKFTLNVEELKTISFDMPFRDLIFNGVPNKSNVQLIPTVNCLVSLIEPPFYITTLREIELVYFERVSVKYFFKLNSHIYKKK